MLFMINKHIKSFFLFIISLQTKLNASMNNNFLITELDYQVDNKI